uniref:(northern house mosquito) hypothetical protein n=1 Tax=Culex pipiens TaxID=7175 RepID=A0A8D8AD97_CULPI
MLGPFRRCRDHNGQQEAKIEDGPVYKRVTSDDPAVQQVKLPKQLSQHGLMFRSRIPQILSQLIQHSLGTIQCGGQPSSHRKHFSLQPQPLLLVFQHRPLNLARHLHPLANLPRAHAKPVNGPVGFRLPPLGLQEETHVLGLREELRVHGKRPVAHFAHAEPLQRFRPLRHAVQPVLAGHFHEAVGKVKRQIDLDRIGEGTATVAQMIQRLQPAVAVPREVALLLELTQLFLPLFHQRLGKFIVKWAIVGLCRNKHEKHHQKTLQTPHF